MCRRLLKVELIFSALLGIQQTKRSSSEGLQGLFNLLQVLGCKMPVTVLSCY